MEGKEPLARRLIVVLTLVAAVSALAPAAFAQGTDPRTDPTAAQYDDNLSQAGGGGAANAQDPGGGLPFTGWDIAAMSSIGLGLMATAIVLRRLSKPRDE
jgi:hypothetical protein